MSEPAWSFKKQQVEQYQFRGPFGAWAIITIDPRGIFQAVSDFGSFAYEGWGHHGRESFKHFLCELTEYDYFLTKTSPRSEVFNFDRTLRSVRHDILRRRREGYLTKEIAREAWDEAAGLTDTSDSTAFCYEVMDAPSLWKHVFGYDSCSLGESCRVEWTPVSRRFFDEVFRGQFVPALEAEIAAAPAPEVRP